MPPKKIRCSFNDCKVAAQRISGDCAFCQGHFCNNHRLLEDHKCRNLDDVSSNPHWPQWWLVGLSDVLSSEDLLVDHHMSDSARRKPSSTTQPSSTRSGHKSSRACNRTTHRICKSRDINHERNHGMTDRHDHHQLTNSTTAITAIKRRRTDTRRSRVARYHYLKRHQARRTIMEQGERERVAS
ncbi:hypothetical protein QBC46DRAFT_370578 [Diplogelasinospora grovesii]|uniref:AN1-type domain-containing protein n=1 Tax=Diplogelasinospora grovesii TaxID=303347 RepID=A0AAN6NL44_9PEZI|nr:hypothetical protein QBC46DRAFT_370578 [Diplogelasinospora grovesii]